jgi:hypothetical protein
VAVDRGSRFDTGFKVALMASPSASIVRMEEWRKRRFAAIALLIVCRWFIDGTGHRTRRLQNGI